MKIYDDKHVGEKIGIYEILYMRDYKSNDGHKVYHIKCNECGWESDIQYRNIKYLSQKCNHLNAANAYVNFNGKNKWQNKRLKTIFNGMVHRCYNKSDKHYNIYGGKGITICNDWLFDHSSFEKWALNNGYNDNLTIDRIDSDKNYCPDNCQWIPLEENARKAGKVNWITVNGETLTGKQWSKKLGLGDSTINRLIKKHGVENIKELIFRMIKEPPALKHRKPRESWLSTYGL